MKTLLTLWFAIALLAAVPVHPPMPNKKLTPGVALPMSKEKVCGTLWGKDERHVTEKMKKQVCAEYHYKTGCPSKSMELDHLLSRELGGADDIRNLWPEPYPSAHWKDRLENALHKDVCSGKISLSQAQHVLVTDWYAEYVKRFGPQ